MSQVRHPIDWALMARLFAIDAAMATGLRRLVRTWPGACIGAMAGGINGRGYGRVRVGGVRYGTHRVVWAIANCADPGSFEVDHLDGDPGNNDPRNLRLATRVENARNVAPCSGTSSRHCGVSWNKGLQKWIAYLSVDGARVHVGLYDSEDAAALARDVAAVKSYGEFARLNFPDAA